MKFVITLLLALALGGCAKNPVTGERDFALMSEQEEIQQGRKFHGEILIQYQVYDNPALQAYVDRVGQSLARVSHRKQLKYTFTVLDSPEINAFALPGGYIYITRGILAYLDSEAELAGVLGHEIGHVTAKHSVRQQSGKLASDLVSIMITATTGEQSLGQLSQTLGTGLVRGYGREHELEADRLGAQYLHRAGYEPDRMLDVIGVLKDQEVYERRQAKKEGREPNIYHGVFSTHPQNDERLKTVVRAARKLSEKEYRDDGERGYQALIDGITWGPSPQQGLIIGNRFIFPPAAFSLQFPQGWRLVNRPEFLDAIGPDDQGLIRTQLHPRQEGETAAELLRRLTRRPDLTVNDNGETADARITVTPSGGDRQPARLFVLILNESRALTLLGTAPEKPFNRTNRATQAAAKSLYRLSERELATLPVPRLRIVERDVSSFAALARGSAFGEDGVDRLRLLNRAYPSGDITRLDRVKTVVAR